MAKKKIKDYNMAKSCSTCGKTPCTCTIDHDKGSIQLKPKHFKAFKEHIEKVKGGYEVESEHGNKNLGKSKSLSAAKKRLKQVEYFKHMHEEHDYEYEMARNQLATSSRSIERLMGMLKGEGNLEAWVQSKLTLAADYLDTVADYMESDRKTK